MKHGAREDHASPQRDRVGDQSWSICGVSVEKGVEDCSDLQRARTRSVHSLTLGPPFKPVAIAPVS